MAFWDNLNKIASDTKQQARVMSESARLNSMISDEEKKLNNAYYRIGKLYASRHKEDSDAEFAPLIATVSDAEQKIQALRAELQDIKGIIRCERCGAEVVKGVAFCNACGNPMPRVDTFDASRYDKCGRCGALVEKGMRFCTTCGNPMAPQAPAPGSAQGGPVIKASADQPGAPVMNPPMGQQNPPVYHPQMRPQVPPMAPPAEPQTAPMAPSSQEESVIPPMSFSGAFAAASPAAPQDVPPAPFSFSLQENPAPPAKRSCKNCGAALDDEMLFCTECGTKIEK